MSAPRKRWDEHSERWKRDALKSGLTPARWNAWFKLSPKSRKTTDPRKYAKGESVAQQRRKAAEQAAYANILNRIPYARPGTVKLGIKAMTAAQLRRAATVDRTGIVIAAARKTGAARNPFWYR